MALSTAHANAVANILRNVAPSTYVNVYLSLHTGDPGATGASEVTGGSYVRKVCALTAAANKHTDNSSLIRFDLMPACTITHLGLWDASTAGNFLVGGALSGSSVIASGASVEFAVGAVDYDLT